MKNRADLRSRQAEGIFLQKYQNWVIGFLRKIPSQGVVKVGCRFSDGIPHRKKRLSDGQDLRPIQIVPCAVQTFHPIAAGIQSAGEIENNGIGVFSQKGTEHTVEKDSFCKNAGILEFLLFDRPEGIPQTVGRFHGQWVINQMFFFAAFHTAHVECLQRCFGNAGLFDCFFNRSSVLFSEPLAGFRGPFRKYFFQLFV